MVVVLHAGAGSVHCWLVVQAGHVLPLQVQTWAIGSHMGFDALQSAFEPQYGMQRRSGVQIRPRPQSPLPTQRTHLCAVVSQAGAAGSEQSRLVTHSTQVLLAGSQIACCMAMQFALLAHSTHTPALLQIGGRPWRAQSALVAHPGTQVCVDGSHFGVVAEQSALLMHCSQVLVVGSHRGPF
jgi:hypothetical protein